ncbi:hypothetical protein VYU27_000174 [Nannochloropsis oceanica]
MVASTCTGMGWRTARLRLCQVCDDVLAAETARLRQKSWHLAAKDALLSQGALFLCVVVLGIGHALGEHYHDYEGDRIAKWVYRAVLLVNVFLNVWIVAARHVCQEREVLGSVRKTVGIYRKHVLTADNSTTSYGEQVAVLKQGSPMVSIYLVFREGKWERVPALLLVEDDIIALGTSDMTPARVEELDCEPGDDEGGVENGDEKSQDVHHPYGGSPSQQLSPDQGASGAWLPAGAKVGFRPDRRISFLRKCTISPTSRRLLVLCGDMRTFRLRETPLQAFLEEMLRPLDDSQCPQHPSPDTLFAKDMRISRHAALFGILVLMGILLIAVSLRFVWQEQERLLWRHYLLEEPAYVAVLALPVARPTLSLLVEALSMARLLTVVERLQEQQREGTKTIPQKKGREDGSDGDLEPEQRIRLTSSRRDRISVRRFFRYFLLTLRARLMPPPLLPSTLRHESAKAHVAVEIEGHHSHREGKKAVPLPPSPQTRSPLLSIPLIRSRTVERLGSVTMLAVVDDELLVADAPSPEEVFLLNPKKAQEASASTVLQIMREPGSMSSHSPSSSSVAAAIMFESPTWTQHLPSLKPLGFSCLALAEMEGRQCTTQQQWAMLGSTAAATQTAATPVAALIDFVRNDSSSQSQAYLGQLARGIGFSAADDLRPYFCERGRLLVVAPHLVDARACEDVSASSLAETRARGTLQPHMTSVVWEDLRRRAATGTGVGDGNSGEMQLLSAGTPSLALPMCLEYFDGSVISHLTAEDRRLIVAAWNAWALEDYHVVCFSYTPIPPVLARRFARRHLSDPPFYLVDNYTEAQQLAHLDAIREQALQEREARMLARQTAATAEGHDGGMEQQAGSNREGTEEGVADAGKSAKATATVNVDPLERRKEDPPPSSFTRRGRLIHGQGYGQPSPSSSGFETPSSQGSSGSVRGEVNAGFLSGAVKSRLLASAQASTSMPDLLRRSTEPILGKATVRSFPMPAPSPSKNYIEENSGTYSDGGGMTGMVRHNQGHGQDDDMLWGLLRRQVFLGMVASSMLPRQEVPGLVEEMMASGVRFLFFSPRNMRRTKKLAEQMGIAMDWNAAVSLRPSVAQVPSSHLIVGRGDVYGDWATKSRLPHGTAAIREHLRNVDNVPLLVSLYTDATPPTINEMFVVFQEYHESVLCVGCGFRCTNTQLFRRADVAIAMGGVPGGLHLTGAVAPFATGAAAGLLPRDIAFNEALVGLFCAFRLGAAADGTVASLAVLTDIVKESRRLLGCFYQCVSLGTTILITVALCVVLPHLFPLPVASTRGQWSLADTLWVLWVILPLLVLPLLVTPADAGLLGRCPRKNVFKPNEHNAFRSGRALVLRCLSTILLCLYVHARCLASLLLRLPDVVTACRLPAGRPPSIASATAEWWAVLACSEHFTLLRQGHGEVSACYWVAHDLLLVSLALCWTVQSSSFLHRTATLREESPLRNFAWVVGGVCLVVGQTLHFVIRGLNNVGSAGLGAIGWDVWLMVVGVAPWVGLASAEYAKRLDAEVWNRHARFRRLEFATRLGMHSPK